MKLHEVNGIPVFKFEFFPDNHRVKHAIFTRQGGISTRPFDSLNLSTAVDDDEANVKANRELAYSTMGRSSETLVHAHLSHSALVSVVTNEDHGRSMGPADGLITIERGCGLTMNYADCSAILLYDPVRKAIGLGHSGWKGSVLDLPRSIVQAMNGTFGSKPTDLIAAIGPTIGPCCYLVGKDVIALVERAFNNADSLLFPANEGRASGSTLRFDLQEANRQRLLEAGVRQIESANVCTSCRTDWFFSHRGENGQTGRYGVMLINGS